MSVTALLETAVETLRDEPEIAWKCYKTATRMALLAFEDENAANRVEIVNHAREVLQKANEKLRSWRGDTIRQILSDEHGAIRGDLEARSLPRARRLLDEYNGNLYRKLKVLRSDRSAPPAFTASGGERPVCPRFHGLKAVPPDAYTA